MNGLIDDWVKVQEKSTKLKNCESKKKKKLYPLWVYVVFGKGQLKLEKRIHHDLYIFFKIKLLYYKINLLEKRKRKNFAKDN